MTVRVVRNRSRTIAHDVHVRSHSFSVDVDVAEGGEDAGPSPHDVYDAALGACKALTMLWYAKRRGYFPDGWRWGSMRAAARWRWKAGPRPPS